MAASPSSSDTYPTRVLAPVERCHADHLSSALAFLNTEELATALQVSQSWFAAASRATAWPEFDIDTALRSDPTIHLPRSFGTRSTALCLAKCHEITHAGSDSDDDESTQC